MTMLVVGLYVALALTFTGLILGSVIEGLLHDRRMDDTVCGQVLQRLVGKH